MPADVINENHMQPVAIKSQRDMLIRGMGFLNGELRSKGQLESDGHVTCCFIFKTFVLSLWGRVAVRKSGSKSSVALFFLVSKKRAAILTAFP